MNEPNQPLRDYRGMDRLMRESHPDWPEHLLLAAVAAQGALYIIAHNPSETIEAMKNFRADYADRIPAGKTTAWERLMHDIAEFPRVYAGWIASKGA